MGARALPGRSDGMCTHVELLVDQRIADLTLLGFGIKPDTWPRHHERIEVGLAGYQGAFPGGNSRLRSYKAVTRFYGPG